MAIKKSDLCSYVIADLSFSVKTSHAGLDPAHDPSRRFAWSALLIRRTGLT